MEAGSSHEIGVWVSGFYGSGKSSLTKYLGLASDQRVTIDGKPFLRHLQDRLHRPTTKALLSKLAASFPAAVVMLDLASEQIAGATLAEVSTVLYYKILHYAGYSRNLKVAALQRRLRTEGRYAEFEQAFRDETGEKWADYQDDDLVVDSVVPRLAHKLYPNLFRSDQAFTTATADTVYLMNDRVQEMIDVVREASGKQHIIFVIDEIGQYVGSQQNKILDLQGLAQNLKDLGHGKVWIVGTAQQTLTEDDPRAAINSPELYKLKDRFPITVSAHSPLSIKRSRRCASGFPTTNLPKASARRWRCSRSSGTCRFPSKMSPLLRNQPSPPVRLPTKSSKPWTRCSRTTSYPLAKKMAGSAFSAKSSTTWNWSGRNSRRARRTFAASSTKP